MARTTFSQRFVSSAASASAPTLERAREAQPRWPGIAAVWRNALSTFSTHSAAILLVAFVGFAAPAIIGNWLYTSAKLSEYARTRAVVSLYDKPSLAVLLVQAGLGVVALTFARGAITWLTLYGKQCSEDGAARAGFGAACRATLARFPALLMGSLLYGALITAGVVMMSAFTQKLEFVPGKMAHVWSGPRRAFGDVLRQLEWRGVNSLLPNPGSPFVEFTPNLRDAVFKQVTRVIYHERYMDGRAAPNIVADVISETKFVGIGEEVIKTHGNPLLAVAGVALIFAAETLLRFRAVMALKLPKSPRLRKFGWLAPLADSTRFGLKHFGAITVHLWLLRLTFLVFTLALVEFPMAMMDHFLVPNAMRFGGDFAVLPILRFMAAASVALVNAILLALSVVYDAHLFMQLTPSSAARGMGADTHVVGYTLKIAPREPAC